MIRFFIEGAPVPKQSVKQGRNRSGAKIWYTPEAMKVWQNVCTITAQNALQKSDFQPLVKGEYARLSLHFVLPDHIARDLDNLTKAVKDGFNKVLYEDDKQVFAAALTKTIYTGEDGYIPGVFVKLERIEKPYIPQWLFCVDKVR